MHSHYDGLIPIFSPGDVLLFNQWIVWAKNYNDNPSTNPKIPIKKIEIVKINNQIKSIKIFKATENYLYVSTDTLSYYPDSLYSIENLQNIKLLGEKKYQISGKFK